MSPNGDPTVPKPPSHETKESQEEARGALFVIWDRSSNRFLLQQRDENCHYFPLKWCFPGEHKKGDERPEDAAVRGALKEYEIVLPEETLDPLVLHKQPHAEGSTQVFVAELPQGQTAVLHEGKALAWLTLEEVKALIDSGEFGFGQEAFFEQLTKYVEDHPQP